MIYRCTPCNFKTDRQSLYARHCRTSSHLTLNFLLQSNGDETDPTVPSNDVLSTSYANLAESDSESDDETASLQNGASNDNDSYQNFPTSSVFDEYSEHSEDEQENNESFSRLGTAETETEWYPFSSKAECLMYVFMHSTTHPISDEVTKYVLFMLKELGVAGVPSLQRLKNFKIGTFWWKEFVTKDKNKENVPVWIVKPSQIVKLNLAHPNTGKLLIRNFEAREEENVFKHQFDGKRCRDLLGEFQEKQDEQPPTIPIPINLFMDDTSTHKSRRWLPFHCVQMQMAGLPLDVRHKQKYISFVGATEKASIMDVLKIVVDDVKESRENGVKAFDAHNKTACILKPIISAGVADFNMMSYCCNHLGATATLYCPKCYSDSESFDVIGRKRTPELTQRNLERLNLRSLETDKKTFRTQKGIKEHDNVLWNVMDPHQDIPVGVLHLIPLGLAKHVTKYIFKNVQEPCLVKIMSHLLSVYPGSQFKDFDKNIDSRQGKDFKTYLQIAPLNMAYADVPSKFVKLTACLATIQKEVNRDTFSNNDIMRLKEYITDFHKLLMDHIPELVTKVKVHLLLHLVEDIKRHGPPKCYLEDSFEKGHAGIRTVVFQQNQKARSRDTASKFAKLMILNHVVTGGYFQDDSEWRTASKLVLNLCLEERVMSHLGLAKEEEEKETKAGTISFLDRINSSHLPLFKKPDYILSLLLEVRFGMTNFLVCSGRAVRAKNGQLINTDDWVAYHEDAVEHYGIFKEGFILQGSSKLLVVKIQLARITEEKAVGCPKVELLERMDFFKSTSITRKMPIIHDCKGGHCRVVEELTTEKMEQEKVTTERVSLKHCLMHKKYVVNMYSL